MDRRDPEEPLRLGWFSTGRGQGSLGLLSSVLEAIDSGRIRARMEFVFCNRERGHAAGSDHFMDYVESRGIPLALLSSRRFRRERGDVPWAGLRDSFDLAAANLLSAYRPDVAVNAGYMLIAPVLCRLYRMINVHPALPGGPVGMWQDVIWELMGQGAVRSGAMVHLVTEDVDEGPVLSYCGFPVRGGAFDRAWVAVEGRSAGELKQDPRRSMPLFRAIRETGLVRERPLLVETLRTIADGRVDLDAAERGEHPALDLTAEVETALS